MEFVTERDPEGPRRPIPVAETLEELPEEPEGWLAVLTLELPVQPRGLVASVFEVRDPRGRSYPFAYCSRGLRDPARRVAGGYSGFFFGGDPADAAHAMTWDQLRAAWPKWRASRAGLPHYPT